MKRRSWTFPTTCRKGHLYGPTPPLDERGSRICVQCRVVGLCAHCRVRPPSRKGRPYCSKACSNGARLVPLADRFLQYYQPGEPDACWPWTGTVDHEGYGVIGDEKRRQIRAHRIAYERVNGAVPKGRNVLHRCDNPPCCNPSHLFAGTIADNNADKRAKGRHSFGSTHGRAKLTKQDVLDIRELYPQMSQQAIADRYGINQTIVSDIVRRVTWKHV